MEEREEQENKEKENKAPEAPKKVDNPSQGTKCTLLITPMNLMPHFHPEPMMSMMMMYLWSLQELCTMKQKVKERKECLQQLLLQRSGMPATPTVLVVAAPFFSAPCTTSTLRTYHRVPPFSSRSGYRTPPEEGHWEEFKTYDLININGGLWYRVPIFTFWCEQVDKGAMPEPDMSNNYVGLYKTHEDTFQIMLTPKPKRLTTKKKK